MRYLILALLLVVGCVGTGGPEPLYINAKGGYLGTEFPDVDGYAFIGLLHLETNVAIDPVLSAAAAATYLGEPSFTYTIQELEEVPDLGGFRSQEVGGLTVYWYANEIPFVNLAAFNLAWLEGGKLHSISVKNGSLAVGVLSDVLKTNKNLAYGDYGFLDGVGLLPDPMPPWHLYAVNTIQKPVYNLSTGFYTTDELRSVEIMLVQGEVGIISKLMINELMNKSGADIGGVEFYEGLTYSTPVESMRKIYRKGDFMVVATTPLEQYKENVVFMDYLIEGVRVTQ